MFHPDQEISLYLGKFSTKVRQPTSGQAFAIIWKQGKNIPEISPKPFQKGISFGTGYNPIFA